VEELWGARHEEENRAGICLLMLRDGPQKTIGLSHPPSYPALRGGTFWGPPHIRAGNGNAVRTSERASLRLSLQL
jgi:hypothetical protein